MYNGLKHLYGGAVITVMKTQLNVCLPQCSSKPSDESAQVGGRSRRDWSSASDRSCPCMPPPPPRRSGANSRGFTQRECRKQGWFASRRGWCHDHCCLVLSERRACGAFDAAGDASERKAGDVWGVQSVCGWTADGVSWEYERKTSVWVQAGVPSQAMFMFNSLN